MKTETNQDYLIAIQSELKAPKKQFNSFGKYNYRSAEDILEAVKPLLNKYGCTLTITENTEEIGGFLVLNSRATISDGTFAISVEAQAGINPNRKGMDIAQSFGSSSSYAKKYALGNLFLLDDTKDADTNAVNEPIAKPTQKIKMNVRVLENLLKGIADGKGKEVKESMTKYDMTKEQEKTLTVMINTTK